MTPGVRRMENDTGMENVKAEPRGADGSEKVSNSHPEEAGMLAMDYNKLYGDLYRKLISTPVGDIFPQFSSSATTSATPGTTASSVISPLPTAFHPAFPVFGACAFPVNGNISPTGLGVLPTMAGAGPMNTKLKSGQTDEQSLPFLMDPSQAQIRDTIDAICAAQSKGIENMDLEKLVERFRDTLEKFGVSQRFAARFIMQDTSQGNLSFLMEKGKNRKWADLSPRGRIPYLRMKAWLESADQQQYTLNMLKQSQDQKRASPRESYSRRERFSMFQIHVLCRLFEENPNPPMNIRNAVAERLNIPLDRVNVWFQNQRARGFPARKFLDQTFSDEITGAPFSSPAQTETRKNSGRRRSGEVCQDISNRNLRPYDFDASLFHLGISNELSMINAHERTDKTTPPKIDWGVMSPENGNQQPIDFSTAKSLVNFSSPSSSTSSAAGETTASASPIGALSDIVENVNSVQKSPEEAKVSTTKSSSNESSRNHGSVEKCASGAAKRKRGMKPQQIIYRTEVEEVNFETGRVQAKPETEVTCSEDRESVFPKRLKLDSSLDSVEKEAERSSSRLESESSIVSNAAQENVDETISTNTYKVVTASNKTVEFGINADFCSGERRKENCERIVNNFNKVQEKALKKHNGSEERTILSAEETVALVHTLYKKKLLEKTVNSSITEPDLD